LEYRSNGSAGALTLEAIYHPEGRITPNGAAFRYEYNIKDHLGNTRLTFADINNNGAVDITGVATTTEVLSENHYYPFGMNMGYDWMNNTAISPDTKYQYNGKEFNDDFGLNWNDYGARWYDGSLGRWMSVDPLAEASEQVDKSPYAYVWGNPILMDDPDGKCPWCAVAGAVVGAGIEIGGQFMSGKSFSQVDWVDVGGEALKGFVKGSGVGTVGVLLTEIGVGIVKASADVSIEKGNQNVLNGGKSKTDALIDGVTDAAFDKLGGKITKSSGKAVESTTKSANNAAKKVTKATNEFNKATNGGANKSGAKAAKATQGLKDAKLNSQGRHAQKKVAQGVNQVSKSHVGQSGLEALENKTSDAIKNQVNKKE
jgi:RHS repeat-associated protein